VPKYEHVKRDENVAFGKEPLWGGSDWSVPVTWTDSQKTACKTARCPQTRRMWSASSSFCSSSERVPSLQMRISSLQPLREPCHLLSHRHQSMSRGKKALSDQAYLMTERLSTAAPAPQLLSCPKDEALRRGPWWEWEWWSFSHRLLPPRPPR
jgi:hypothetical protein